MTNLEIAEYLKCKFSWKSTITSVACPCCRQMAYQYAQVFVGSTGDLTILCCYRCKHIWGEPRRINIGTYTEESREVYEAANKFIELHEQKQGLNLRKTVRQFI